MQETKFMDSEIIKKINSSSEPSWMKEKRLEALDNFNSLPMPQLRYGINISLNSSEINFNEINIPEKKQITLPKIKGIIIENLSDALKNHEEIIRKHFLSSFTVFGKFESLHAAIWNKGIFVYVPKNTEVQEPLKLSDLNSGFEFQHNIIILDENSSLSIFEEELSNSEEKSYKTKVTEIFVNNNSILNYANFQNLSKNTINFSTKRASIGQNASINWIDFSLGSKLSKSEILTKLEKEGASTNVFSLFFSNKDQQFDFNSSILHNAKHTISDMVVRGVLDNKSKVVYNGLVRIGELASNSNGYQKQDALLLSPNAEIDPIPNLEINNNDVKCSHGTTVSKLDKEKLFYLKSRGLSEEQATKLMIKGFFEPVIKKIKTKEDRNEIRKAILSKL